MAKKIDKTKLTKNAKRKTTRPDIDSYFLKMAMIVSERGTCQRHSVGSVIVKDKQVISTGYNGAPRGAKDCLELGCLKDKNGIKSGDGHNLCRAVHAEQNAIIQASSRGMDMRGATMYCTHTPCNICARMIANSGIKEVVMFEKYACDLFKDIFDELGIGIRFLAKPKLEIDFFE
jgi:dCMP deaminase